MCPARIWIIQSTTKHNSPACFSLWNFQVLVSSSCKEKPGCALMCLGRRCGKSLCATTRARYWWQARLNLMTGPHKSAAVLFEEMALGWSVCWSGGSQGVTAGTSHAEVRVLHAPLLTVKYISWKTALTALNISYNRRRLATGSVKI